jgi:hypothetical protein
MKNAVSFDSLRSVTAVELGIDGVAANLKMVGRQK